MTTNRISCSLRYMIYHVTCVADFHCIEIRLSLWRRCRLDSSALDASSSHAIAKIHVSSQELLVVVSGEYKLTPRKCIREVLKRHREFSNQFNLRAAVRSSSETVESVKIELPLKRCKFALLEPSWRNAGNEFFRFVNLETSPVGLP